MNRFVVFALAGLLSLSLIANVAQARPKGGFSGSRSAGRAGPRSGGRAISRPRAKAPWRSHRPRVVVVPNVVADSTEAGSESTETQLPEQTERYLKVVNSSGQDLTVYVKLNEDDQPWRWQVPAGADAYLTIKGKYIIGSTAYIWAESESGTVWNKNKDEAQTLVAESYEAEEPGTFTYTFNP